jgi:flagellar protein FlaJ
VIEILRNFFILIGDIALSSVNLFKTISLKNIEKKEKSNPLLDRLNLQTDMKVQPGTETQLDKLRENLLKILLTRYAIAILLISTISITLLAGLELAGIFSIIVVMAYVFILYYPQIKEQKNYSDITQELPYALRHMGIELKSGKGLHDSLRTIKNSNYGSLSDEFNRVLEEIKFGKTTEDSVIEMAHRVKSDGLSRAIHQIISTLRVGGNLSNSLNIIAKDITFDMHIKLKEYSQKLNSFILIYTFIAILTPVISLIMLMAGSTVMGDIISANLLLVIYTLFFPMIVMFMGVFIKKLEPKI